MKAIFTTPLSLALAIAAALSLAASAGAAPGGRIGTLERGAYSCETPGDVTAARGVPAPEEDFTITNASTYQTPEGSGTYLRTGDVVTMTSGPKKGQRFEMKNERFLRRLGPDGLADGLRCVRMGG
jgi:hypothetical protein